MRAHTAAWGSAWLQGLAGDTWGRRCRTETPPCPRPLAGAPGLITSQLEKEESQQLTCCRSRWAPGLFQEGRLLPFTRVT